MAKPKQRIARKAGNAQGKDQDPTKVFLRHLIFTNPQLSVEQANEALRKAGKAGNMDTRLLNGVKSGVVRSLGITTNELPPPKKNGSPNLAALLRLYVEKNPDASTAQAETEFAAMGLKVSSVALSTAKKSLGKGNRRGKLTLRARQEAKEESSGPRARKMTKQGRRKVRTAEEVEERQTEAGNWEQMEKELDTLIGKADNAQNSKLAQSLRNARRLVSAKIVQLVT